jgi:hypothetical protein
MHYRLSSITRLVAGLSPWMFGFDSRPIRVRFIADKVALGHVLLRVLRFHHIRVIPSMLHIHLYPSVFLTEDQKLDDWEPSVNRNALSEIGEQWIGRKFHLITCNVSDVRTPHYVMLHLALYCGVILICYTLCIFAWCWAVNALLYIVILNCVDLSLYCRPILSGVYIVHRALSRQVRLCLHSFLLSFLVELFIPRYCGDMLSLYGSLCCFSSCQAAANSCLFLSPIWQQEARIYNLNNAISWRRRKLIRYALLKMNAAPLHPTRFKQEPNGCLCGAGGR